MGIMPYNNHSLTQTGNKVAKEEIINNIEMLVAYNIVYIVLGYAVVGIASWFAIDPIAAIVITAIVILYNNKLHLSRSWIKLLKSL